MREKQFWKTFIILLVLALLISFIFPLIPKILGFSTPSFNIGLDEFSVIVQFLIIVIIAPVVETLLFQHFPIYITRLFVQNKYIEIITSATLFALVHSYHYWYVLMAFLAGIILGYWYLYAERKKVHGIIACIIFHVVYNGFAFFVNTIEKILKNA